MSDSHAQSPIVLNKWALFFGDALVSLFFVSKLSLAFAHFIPYNIPPLIYQGGIHPYVNIVGNLCFGAGFILNLRKGPWSPGARLYSTYLILFVALLCIQTFVQMAFVHPDKSMLFQMSGAIMATITVLLYGLILPMHYPVSRFVKVMLWHSVLIVLCSLALLPLFGSSMFRGGRFVGITKHIPHMVTMSSIAAIFLISRWPKLFSEQVSVPKVMGSIAVTALCFLAVALTATKAAMGSLFLACLLALFFLGKRTRAEQWGRLFVLASMTISLSLLAPVVGDTLYEVASGERALLGRPAQNGFETRWEEVVRGGDLFLRSPHAGLGILYKFMTSSGDGDVDTYNSFKDPHNIFLSAGVIGGWPFMIIVGFGYLALIYVTFTVLRPNHRDRLDIDTKTLAIFLATHLPVFLIYHVHLSLGGIADRVYWCVIGYVILTPTFFHSGRTPRTMNVIHGRESMEGHYEKTT